MKEYKTNAILYLLSGIMFLVCSLINFFDGNESTSGVMYVCLSVTFLCLSLTYFSKYKNKKK